MALKRFVDGAAGQPFFQKRAPENVPDFIRTATLTFPSGRTADEIVIDEAAGLAWVNNLGCIDLNPHPVRADDLDHPDELRVDLDPVPGVPWDHIRLVALATREALEAVGLVGWPKTSGSRGIHINVRIEPRWTFPEVRRAALALARDVERRVPDLATSKWWKEERHGVFLDYNQNAKDRTVASAYSVRPLPDARVSTPLSLGRGPDGRGRGVHDRDGAGPVRGDRRPGRRDRRGGRVARGAAGAERAGRGRGPGRRAVAAELRQAGRRAAAGPAVEGAPAQVRVRAGPRRGWRAAARRRRGTGGGGRCWRSECRPPDRVGRLHGRPRPAAARRTIPVVEISRAEFKEEALEGLERWKARHPEVVPYLEPADILVDGMRGRSALWYRVRVNLIHVPEADRPAQEPLESDYDPWAGMDIEAWKAATAGSRARKPAPRSKPEAGAAPDEPAHERGRTSVRLAMIEIVGIDHVQLAMPAGGEDVARRFYGEILGLREVPKPPELAGRGGCWFAGPNTSIHLAPEDGFAALKTAHPALIVGHLDAARAGLVAAGVTINEDDSGLPIRRFYMRDPFGNRIELDDARDAGFSER